VNDPGNDHVSVVAESLLDYLEHHPNCADTKEGIVRWWVLAQHVQEQIATVELALDNLVQKGLVERSDITGRTIYRAIHSTVSNG